MKFKVGDKVKHKDFGVGEIIGFDGCEDRYAVEFKNEHNGSMHNFPNTYMRAGLSNPIDRKAGRWCLEGEIELVEEAPKNLIPQIAKMLGVEIGEEFYIKGWSSFKHKFENGTLMSRTNGNLYEEADYKTWVHLIKGNYQDIVKLPQKPILTEDEKVILRNLPKEYKWIARDESCSLNIYDEKPDGKGAFHIVELYAFKHLFQFIKWKDEKPYNIEELLKGE